jgi:hypothetical protein
MGEGGIDRRREGGEGREVAVVGVLALDVAPQVLDRVESGEYAGSWRTVRRAARAAKQSRVARAVW